VGGNQVEFVAAGSGGWVLNLHSCHITMG
jgi:hypothetical protein